MNAKEAYKEILQMGLAQQFKATAEILGMSFREAREQVPTGRVFDFLFKGDFAEAAEILGIPFEDAWENTPMSRRGELVEVAHKGSPLTRRYFMRNIYPGKKQPTGFRNPVSHQRGSWEGFGIYNLIPASLKRDSRYDFFGKFIQ